MVSGGFVSTPPVVCVFNCTPVPRDDDPAAGAFDTFHAPSCGPAPLTDPNPRLSIRNARRHGISTSPQIHATGYSTVVIFKA